MNNKPLISMIIPTHNRAELLQEALNSVYAQEGVGEQFEMEIIVIDDASSDATPEIMRRNPVVRYIRLETNLGASAARNVGIRASKGKYMAFLDDDDLCLSHRLLMHVSVLETHPEVGVVYGQMICTGDGKPTLWPDASRAPSGSTFHAVLMAEFILMDCVLVRREAFETAGCFDENLGTMEHYGIFVRLAFHVPFAFVPGAVAVGRFSDRGKWFTNIKKGGYEKTVPFIVERALAKLPDNAETAELRRKVRLSWFAQITYWLGESWTNRSNAQPCADGTADKPLDGYGRVGLVFHRIQFIRGGACPRVGVGVTHWCSAHVLCRLESHDKRTGPTHMVEKAAAAGPSVEGAGRDSCRGSLAQLPANCRASNRICFSLQSCPD